MRKSLSLFLAASLAVCFSCTKQEEQIGGQAPSSHEQGDFDYITAIGPGSQVKTIVSNGTKVLWADDDKIGLYSGGTSSSAEFTTVLEEPSAQARFGRTSTSKPVKVNDCYYAVYPSSAVALWSVKDGETAQTAGGLHLSTRSIVSSEHLLSGNWVAPSSHPCPCHSSCLCGGLFDALFVLHTGN